MKEKFFPDRWSRYEFQAGAPVLSSADLTGSHLPKTAVSMRSRTKFGLSRELQIER